MCSKLFVVLSLSVFFAHDYASFCLSLAERNRIKQLVIRDYRGDEGLKDDSAVEHRLQDPSRSFTRGEATTLSDEASFVTQDSLFDYGAQLSNRSI